MKSFNRILSLILAVVLVLTLIGSALVILVSAADAQQLSTLLENGQVKPLGRTQVNSAGDGITADWSGTGFEINVNATGGSFVVGYKASYDAYWVVHVDGQQVWRGLASSGAGTFQAVIPAGKHTVSVIKETQISSSTSAYCDLTTLSFDGTIEAAPANQGLYIEFVGDSYSCGDGALGEYQPGVAWIGAHDSATHGFPWYTAQALNADYSIVARGGIGLFDGMSEQEATVNKVTMADIYSYASGYRSSEGTYGFTRKPDIVVVELGANDGIDNSDSYKSITAWAEKLAAFIDQVRAKNGPDTKIVMLSHNADKYYQMLKLAEDRADTDPNLFACHYSHNGNGSAALATQKEGHPDYEDHQAIAKALVNFMKTNGVIDTQVAAPSYTDHVYYVSETGSDSNAGTADAPKATLYGALNAAQSGTYGESDRIVVWVSGAVVGSSGQLFGGVGAIKNSAGERVPILVATKDYTGSNAAELKITFKPTAGGACAIYPDNDFYFKDVIIKSYSNGSYCVNSFYSASSDITFDNVTLTTDKQSNYMTWLVSTGNFANGAGILDALEKDVYSSITFLNGNYTDVYRATVTRDGVWTSAKTYTELPYYHGKIVIGEGATVKDVYGLYGSLAVASATVEIRGGTVTNFYPTASGTSDAYKTYTGDLTTVLENATIGNTIYSGTGNYVTVNGDVTNTFLGGRFTGRQFNGVGNYVTVNGNVVNNISGGEIRINPTNTGKDDGFYLAGHNSVTVNGNVTNNISGGDLNLIYNTASIDSGIYLGTRSGGKITGDLINNISGGNLCTLAGTGSASTNGIYLGMYSGNIYGTLKNNISAGTLDVSSTGGGINFGDRTVNNLIGSFVNVLGSPNSSQGPRFLGAAVSLAGGWAQIGVDAVSRAVPDVSVCSDTVVMDTTIYEAYFSSAVYAGINGTTNTGNGYYSFIVGSVRTNIYGGKFAGGFYGSSAGEVYGHVTTNVYGGIFTNLYGARTGKVYDGVELNIYGMTEYYPTTSGNTWGIYAGGTTSAISVQTAGRDAAKLTIAPENAEDLTLNTPIYAKCSGSGTITGNVTVQVSGGTFPQGFAVAGKTVGEALADGCAVYDITTGTKASYADADTSVSGQVAVCAEGEEYSRELVYYVSENGQDAYSGTSPATPKLTLAAAFAQAITDNGSYKFPVGTKVTIYVEGEVVNNAGSTQILGGGQVFIINDISNHVPITVTTYNYSGEKATILTDHLAVNDGNASMYVVNDITFKDIDIKAITNPATGFCSNKLYAAGCSLTFDNCTITNDGAVTKGATKWSVYADHFSTGGFNPLNTSFLPLYGTVTFKNGDYTSLDRAAAVGAGNIYRSASAGGSVYEVAEMYCKLVIGEGAKMGTVYGTYGTLAVGSATVEIQGGTVEQYIGTASGTDSAKLTYATPLITTVSGGTVNSFMGTGDYINLTGDVTNTFSGGSIGGEQFAALGNNVTLTGNLTNTFSGAKLVIYPTHQGQNHGIFLSGRDNTTVDGNVVNNISAGELGVIYNVAEVQSGIYFGSRNGGKITGNLTNNISGGSLYTRAGTATPKYASIHFGMFVGHITGNLVNNITGGTFEIAKGAYYFGHQGIHCSTHHIINTLGAEGSTEGPSFTTDHPLFLAGGWGRIGVAGDVNTQPDASADCTDALILSTTIYGGTFSGSVVAGGNAAHDAANARNTYIKGSVRTDIYSGTFAEFYGSGTTPVYGKVTTNVYGGTFDAIYGARDGKVYDGVELNIYAMAEGEAPTGIWAGPTAGAVSTVTSGRDAVKLTVDPTDSLELSMPISVKPSDGGTITGTVTATVTGGTYTNGFGVDGKTVDQVLAEGLLCRDQNGKLITVTETTTNTGVYTVLSNTGADLALDGAQVTLSGVDAPVIYDGTDKKPTVTVTLAGKTLAENTDYTVSYQRDGSASTDFVSMGTVTVIITGKGLYTGSLTASYEIVRDPAIAEAIQAVTEKVNAYDMDTVTPDDEADIRACKDTIASLLATYADLLTQEEAAALNALDDTCDDLLAQIQLLQDIAARIAQAKALLEGLTVENVTSADEENIGEALEIIDALLADPDLLTEAQAAELKALQDTAEALLERIQAVKDTLAKATELVSGITLDNVNSDNKANVEEAKALIDELLAGDNLTDAEHATWTRNSQLCQDALDIIAETAEKISEAQSLLEGLTAENVSADDKNAIEDAKALIEELLDSDHLTDTERQELEALQDLCDALLVALQGIEESIAEAKELLDGLTTENVTSEDVESIEDALEIIEALLENTDSLTDEQVAELEALKETAEELLEQVENAAEAADSSEVEDITAETVEPEDQALLEETQESLEEALEEYEGNYTDEEKAAIEEALEQIKEALEVLDNVAAAEELLEALPETAEPDDEAVWEDVLEAVEVLEGLTDHELELIDEALMDKLDGLLEDLTAYAFTQGSGQTWSKGKDSTLTFTANGALSHFTGLKVDGQTVDPKHYTTADGSTVITLSEEFLKTLSEGAHTITAEYVYGAAQGTFTVEIPAKTPDTGDGTNPVLLTVLATLSLLALAAVDFRRRTR